MVNPHINLSEGHASWIWIMSIHLFCTYCEVLNKRGVVDNALVFFQLINSSGLD